MVDKLSEDSSPKITGSKVTWTQDQGKALFEIKTVQRDSGLSGWGVSGYIMLALGMILLAIPAIKAIQWIKRSCGGRTRNHPIDEEEAEDKLDSIGKYNSVKYTPSSEGTEKTDYDSKPSISMAKLQDKLEHEISILSREYTKDE